MVNREIMFEVTVLIINPQKGFASQDGQKGQENPDAMRCQRNITIVNCTWCQDKSSQFGYVGNRLCAVHLAC